MHDCCLSHAKHLPAPFAITYVRRSTARGCWREHAVATPWRADGGWGKEAGLTNSVLNATARNLYQVWPETNPGAAFGTTRATLRQSETTSHDTLPTTGVATRYSDGSSPESNKVLITHTGAIFSRENGAVEAPEPCQLLSRAAPHAPGLRYIQIHSKT